MVSIGYNIFVKLLDLPTVALWDKTEGLFFEGLFSSSLPLSNFNFPGSNLGGKI